MPETALFFLHALTSLHPGSGTALGVVDLPVQRERHTGWPIVPGSSLKGVLRDECRRAVATSQGVGLDEANNDGDVTNAFGPARVDAADTSYAGAVSVTDARVAAFPVRSMAGVFAWVTCPAVLQRMSRDLAYMKNGGSSAVADSWPTSFPQPAEDEAVVPTDTQLVVKTGGRESIILEEFEFQKASETSDAVAAWFAEHAVDEPIKERMRGSLVVLHDDTFGHFVQHATEIVARIGLDYARKTVKQGALFYEEYLPPETVLYSLLAIEDGRQADSPVKPAKDILEFLRNNVPLHIQIGADETIGKGLCAVRIAE